MVLGYSPPTNTEFDLTFTNHRPPDIVTNDSDDIELPEHSTDTIDPTEPSSISNPQLLNHNSINLTPVIPLVFCRTNVGIVDSDMTSDEVSEDVPTSLKSLKMLRSRTLQALISQQRKHLSKKRLIFSLRTMSYSVYLLAVYLLIVRYCL